MHRLACVDLPAFPLQLLAQSHPDWREKPMAVVAEEKPQAFILWVNEKAWEKGIRPGHRYAAALALSTELRAGAVNETAIRKGVEGLTESLRRFTPEVEPADETWRSPGLFWLNASGLIRLYPSLDVWGRAVRDALSERGFVSSVVVGFTRFGTYAVARAKRGLVVFKSREEEERVCRGVPLVRLDIPPEAQETFRKLRIRTVADFLRLPAKGLLKRFGPQVHALHRLAMGDLFSPLRPKPPEELFFRTMELPSPETDAERLVFFVKQILDDLLKELDRKTLALVKLHLRLLLDDRSALGETLRPDAPTLNGPLLVGLVRLRLETLSLEAGAVELTVSAEVAPKTNEQLSLVAERPRRDPSSCHRAFARLRAEFGERAVVRAALKDGHLPASRFEWAPLESFPEPGAPEAGAERSLIRRIFDKPVALPHRSRHEP
ncbi:MAG TPA: DNA polymerase Y family protein, partial [Vicinamibacteria bacterium]|nr:DNA polymerase Y family protein [Vicinamibacteria bacterium]